MNPKGEGSKQKRELMVRFNDMVSGEVARMALELLDIGIYVTKRELLQDAIKEAYYKYIRREIMRQQLQRARRA